MILLFTLRTLLLPWPLKNLKLSICECHPASTQLIALGLFPSAPMRPSLAVSISLLEFNQQSVEAFLKTRPFASSSVNQLRHRYGNALHWYCYLQQMASTLSVDGPSEYLRSHCPLCFGNDQCYDEAFVMDCIVCLDACFTQKRRHSPRDAEHHHPNSVLLSEDKVQKAEELVTRCCQSHVHSSPEGLVPGMQVSPSILQECHDSFKAADEQRAKASTQFFSDTGLMALLCHHDIVLWMVIMTSPGERQYYALALLSELLENLPKTTRVGCLYDIGCQLHHSCVKWNFLKDDLARVQFGISVFHAFAHNWGCQLVYHPRKCKGFGLSDGEGCERLWSELKKLIPSLRVSGYHHHLSILDSQVLYLHEKSLFNFGEWMACKWMKCQKRKNTAEAILAGHDLPTLCKEWTSQVASQTKPLPRQSKNKGTQAVQKALLVMDNVADIQKSITTLEIHLATSDSDLITINVELQSQKEHLAAMKVALDSHLAALGVEEIKELKRLKSSHYLQDRMNARALKYHIRECLHQRKFEFDRLTHEYRQTINDVIDKKLHTHTQSAISRREPAIMSLVVKYNSLCDKLEHHITHDRAPQGVISPLKIFKERLWSLDVDDGIWQDVGLEDAKETHAIPNWLGNDETRQGIQAMLEFNCCVERERRLKREQSAMQCWMKREWDAILKALADTEDEALQNQLELHKRKLLELCVIWQRGVEDIPHLSTNMSWGPSMLDIAAVRLNILQELVDEDNSSSVGSNFTHEDSEDAEVLDLIENFGMVDVSIQQDVADTASHGADIYIARKRHRID
ncbi:hypothetical protein L210DRAFT_961007 [Boletus edulis BED1]|uniref:CxC2-like cysteine cluster KDZ transposase-associated domain-containing protein n=1 Tax=Boletus edulis BED1 TaxID=1328754 RepID=A0AAD4BQA7_BOLED|nr:hypothetical protein L210DRAFT_961007 [Boletus edulis BED1]